MAQNHRQLTRVGMRRPVMPDPQSPAILGVRKAVGARPQVDTRRIAAHADAARRRRQNGAQESVGENRSPPTVHGDGGFLPAHTRRGRQHPCSSAHPDSIDHAGLWEHQRGPFVRIPEGLEAHQGIPASGSGKSGMLGKLRNWSNSGFCFDSNLGASPRGLRPVWKTGGTSLKWVFWPGVFGVAPAEVFSHLVVGCGPEAFEVVRDLHRAIVRARGCAARRESGRGDPGGFGPAEELLEADCQDRRPSGFVGQTARVAYWAGKVFGVRSRAIRGSVRARAGTARMERGRLARSLRGWIFPGRRFRVTRRVRRRRSLAS